MSRTTTATLIAALAAAGCASGSSQPPAGPAPVPVAADAEPLGTTGAGERRIGPDDLLEVEVFEAPELSRSARVTADGSISLPVLGRVPAAGLTPDELQTAIEGRLRGTFMVDPQVSVEVAEVRSQPIYVLGSVKKPGAFPLTGYEQLTFLRALALGEGLDAAASRGRAFIIRTGAGGQRVEIPVDVDDVIQGRMVDPALQANDIVYVPNSRVRTLTRGVVDNLVRAITLGRIF